MTPAARIQAAAEILDLVLSGTPAEKALTTWARRSRFAGSKDRRGIRDHVFQALRCRRSYAALGGSLTGRGLMIGAIRAAGEPVDRIFTGEGYGPAALSPEEAAAPTSNDPFAVWDLPDWLIDEFEKSLCNQPLATAQALTRRAPVMCRVNLRKTDVAGALAELAEDGIAAEPHPIASTAVKIVDGAARLARSPAYQNGLIELQDGSSQAAMETVTVPAGANVLDYCAGGGGKTLALAAQGDAALYAHDAQPERMNDLPDRARRAGVKITSLPLDALPHHAPFDLVVCDVPCSGSGSWRRTPEAKWALTPQRLHELIALQAQILDATAPLVAPGGTLVYATCSLFDAENQDQITAFLTRAKGWHCTVSQHWPVSQGGDGFFVAHLVRTTGSLSQT